jgi:hypothetical protein
MVEAFRRGLRDLGYIERKNIIVEYRYPGTTAIALWLPSTRPAGRVAELGSLDWPIFVSG